MTEFRMVIQVGEMHIYRGSAMCPFLVAGPDNPKILRRYLRPNRFTCDEIWYGNTCGAGACFRRSAAPLSQRGLGHSIPQIFKTSYMCAYSSLRETRNHMVIKLYRSEENFYVTIDNDTRSVCAC